MRISDWSSDVCSSDLRRRSGCGGRSGTLHFRSSRPIPRVEGLARAGRAHRRMTGKKAADIGAEAHHSHAEAMARAEAAVAALRVDYLRWVEEDLAKLDAALSMAARDAAQRDAALQDVHRVAHDMRGQGGSFGYPLVTRIAASLCRFVEMRGKDAGEAEMVVLRHHLAALRDVIGRRAEGEGEGDDVARQAVAQLEVMAAGSRP